MGNAHTHRNKRGGRHNRGAPTRPQGAGASASTAGIARPQAAPANPPPAPSAPLAPSSGATPPRRAGMPSGRSRGEPSLRTPYAPGQRAPHGPHQPAPPVARPTEEREGTGTAYEEFVVTTHRMETAPDQGNAPEPSAPDRAEGFANPSAEHLPPAHRHNGRADGAVRHNGHLREHDHDHSYTPVSQRPEFERDGVEVEPLADEDRESPDALPRGDVRGEVGALIDDLKAVFQRDRSTASTNGDTRCGICYLHFALDELEYRDAEGYYVCAGCAQALGAARLPMVRRQKRA